MAYNATLALALSYIEIETSTSTHPTTVQATAMWGSVYADMLATLAACGVTVVASTESETRAKDIEAMLTSAKVGEDNEMQADGEVSDHTKWLKEQGLAALEKLCGYDYAEALGATVTRKGPRPRSMATEYPNSSLGTSGYESPLQDDWTREGDL